jgi:hypothetical protein
MLKYLVLISLGLSTSAFAIEKAEGVVYCHGKTVIEYRLVNPQKNGTASDVDLTINGKTTRYMTAYSWFGSNQPAPKNFKFAILGEGRFDPLLVFENRLVDAKNTQYSKCN